jgi:hypothetical protein
VRGRRSTTGTPRAGARGVDATVPAVKTAPLATAKPVTAAATTAARRCRQTAVTCHGPLGPAVTAAAAVRRRARMSGYG